MAGLDLGPTSLLPRSAASGNKVKKERSTSKLKLPKGLWQDWTSVRPLCCSLQPQVIKSRKRGKGQKVELPKGLWQHWTSVRPFCYSGRQPPIIKTRERGQGEKVKLPKGLWQDWTSVRPLCCGSLQPPGHQVAKKRRPAYWIPKLAFLFCPDFFLCIRIL